MSKAKRKLPPVSFYFAVKLLGVTKRNKSQFDAEFQEISGITAELEFEEIKEGGENRFSHRVPGRVKYDNLVLKRGLVIWPSEFGNWCKDTLTTTPGEDQRWIERRDINVYLMNRHQNKSEPIRTWSFVNAIPSKWEISNFNSQESNLAMETITFSYQYFSIVK